MILALRKAEAIQTIILGAIFVMCSSRGSEGVFGRTP